MREVRLYGHLGKKFGRKFKLNVKSPAEAIAALRANFKDFAAYLTEHSAPGYRVYVGERNVGQSELQALSGDAVIKIVPVVAGAKKGGIGQIILGAILVVVGYVVPGAQALIKVGASLILGGMAQMLFAPPKSKTKEDPKNLPSYSFDGPVNTAAQGNPVPVCYGQMLVGSQVVSAGFAVDEIFVPPPMPAAGTIITKNFNATVISVTPESQPTPYGELSNPASYVQVYAGANELVNGHSYTLVFTTDLGSMNKYVTYVAGKGFYFPSLIGTGIDAISAAEHIPSVGDVLAVSYTSAYGMPWQTSPFDSQPIPY